MEFFILLAAFVLAIAFVAYVRRGQHKISCPQCSSVQVRTVDRQLKKLTQGRAIGQDVKDLGGLGNFGIKLDVQLIMETQYRCQACSHAWTVIAPEK